MPHVRVVTATPLAEGKKDEIVHMISTNIGLIAGKTAAQTMIEILDGTSMYMDDQKQNCVFIELKIFGWASSEEKKQIFELFCKEIASITGAQIQHVYMSILEYDSWGVKGIYAEKKPE